MGLNSWVTVSKNNILSSCSLLLLFAANLAFLRSGGWTTWVEALVEIVIYTLSFNSFASNEKVLDSCFLFAFLLLATQGFYLIKWWYPRLQT